MNIEQKLTATVIAALNNLYGQEVAEKMVQLQKTKKEFEGHLTLVVFPFLKMSKKGPEQTAAEIGEYLKQNAPELVSNYNAVKGFLNLTISSDCWIELLNSIHCLIRNDTSSRIDCRCSTRDEWFKRLYYLISNKVSCFLNH